MDKSLDDIISANKGKFSLRRGGATRRGGSGGAKGTAGRGRGRGGGGGRGRQSLGSSPRGGVQKRRSGPTNNYSRGPMPDVWSHDKFSEQVPFRGNRGGASAVGGASGGGGSKLMISNLDYGVNDSDVQELFTEFGDLKKAAVHYDKSGRSLGTAEVFYLRRADAIKALKQYNGVPLDGRPMSIQLVGEPAQASAPASKRLGTARGGATGGGTRGRGAGNRGGQRGGRGGRGGGRGGAKKPPPNADDLDKELDDYRSKMDTS